MTDSIKKILKNSYPQAYKELSLNDEQELPFSQETVFLSEKNRQSVQKIVKKLHQLKEDPLYQEAILNYLPEAAKKNNLQNSPLMAYDFHIQQDSMTLQENSNKIQQALKVQEGSVKLIEINTNASAFLLANLLYQSSSENFENSLKALKKSFLKEWGLFNQKRETPKIVLIDEDIKKQKMRFEFFMYQDFFKSMGWELEILESKSLLMDEEAFLYTPSREKIDFIYNRTTDFYFEKHPKLLKAYQKQSCLILPQPRDYALLSDKKRFVDWQKLPQLESIQKYLLNTKVFNKENQEEIWKNRKKYFFKIQQGYGGKLAYRGSSLSNKKKEELLKYNSLAQEYCSPSILIDSEGKKWKVDLRVYVYKDQVQQLIARVYQGQITNFQIKGSGFAKVKIVS